MNSDDDLLEFIYRQSSLTMRNEGEVKERDGVFSLISDVEYL